MENNLIKLLKLDFNLDDFYIATIYPKRESIDSCEISLQGWSTPEKLNKYTQLGYVFEKNSNGYLSANLNKVEITLT
jgi:hypothetical protein